MSTPTEAEFCTILNAPDEAVISIRGHVAIESALSEVLAHALPSASEIELERISFPLKIDLVIALRAIRPESRPLFMKLNKVRNRFAHKAAAMLEGCDRNEILNAMSPLHKKMVGEHFAAAKTPRAALRVGTAAAFYEAKSAAQHLFAQRVEKEEMSKEIERLLEETKHLENHPAAGGLHEKVQRRVKQRLAQVQSSQPAPAQPGASPNGGPAMRPMDSGASGGPSSVS